MLRRQFFAKVSSSLAATPCAAPAFAAMRPGVWSGRNLRIWTQIPWWHRQYGGIYPVCPRARTFVDANDPSTNVVSALLVTPDGTITNRTRYFERFATNDQFFAELDRDIKAMPEDHLILATLKHAIRSFVAPGAAS